MSNSLVSAESLTNLPSTDVVDLSAYGSETKYLPRIQLYSKGKPIDTGKIKPGRYGSPGSDDEILDLGESIDVLLFAVRDKALDAKSDPSIAVYDKQDPMFADIADRSNEKDSRCMYGPSFLVWERNTAKFYEFFCMNKSARIASTNMGQFLAVSDVKAQNLGVEAHGPIPCTLSAKYIPKATFAWHAPEVSKCSTPIDNLPEMDVILKEIDKFLNPPKNGPELAEDEEER